MVQTDTLASWVNSSSLQAKICQHGLHNTNLAVIDVICLVNTAYPSADLCSTAGMQKSRHVEKETDNEDLDEGSF